MRSRRLVWHLYPSYLLLILVVLLAIGWYLSVGLRQFHYQQTSNDLRSRAQLVEQLLQGQIKIGQQGWLTQQVKRFGENSGTRITIVMRDGRVLADSHEDPLQMDNHGQRPEILDAFAGGQGVSIRFSQTLGQSLMYVALPINQADQVIGCVRTAIPVVDIDATLRDVYRQLAGGGLLIALLAALICWWLSRRISRPLEKLTTGVQRISRGELGIPLEATGIDETDRLAVAMTNMADELADQFSREVEQRSEIEAILGCMSEGIIAVDSDERVIRLNQAAAELFGVSVNQVSGRPIQELIRQSELLRFISRALTRQDALEDEITLFGAQNRYLHVQATPLTGNSAERIGELIAIHDLTRLRQLESVRRDFVANVSHELKTPITAIRGAVETLLDEVSLDKASRRFLQIIFKQSERLNALVEDLLDLSRIEQGGEGNWDLQLQPLLTILEGARTACESLMNQQQIDIRINCPETVQARINTALLEQAIINLLTNAIKFSDSGSQVIIDVSRHENRICIQVKDFGCGIEPEHLPRLFERFYRVDLARSRKQGGTGLGLAIVKHATQAHGGEVRVTSTPGEGSCFSILLPDVTATPDS
jgi:two-component system phosphate regulon sensor histidine kinase PhoR